MTRFWRMLEMAFRSLTRNKMRSGLTMLGIVIGVGVVVAMVAIGDGAKQSVRALIQGLGSNVLILLPGSSGRGGVHGGFGTVTSLTAEDIEAVVQTCPAVIAGSPVVRTAAQVVAGNRNWSTSVQGVSCDFIKVRDWPLSEGACFSNSELRRGATVCILGRTVAQQLFGDGDVYGQTLRVQNIPFQVVGVLQPKGASGFGRDEDDVILMPWTTAQRRLAGIRHVSMAYLSAASDEAIPGAIEQVRAVLRERHRLRESDDDDFVIRSQLEIAERAQAQVGVLSTTFAIVALVSLVVGGIGVMNIMLVSVTERTREVGIRMAVGAKPRHILSQFLTEAVVLCLAGGLVGIGVGVGISRLVSRVMQWPSITSPGAMVLAIGVSGAVGVFFGYYPARRAALLDPIEALRYE